MHMIHEDDKSKALFLIWSLLIALVTLVPQPSLLIGGVPTHLDKVGHLVLFFVFAALAFRLRPEWSSANYVTILFGVLVYSTVIEYLQLFVPGRFADPLDVVAGIAGALACVFLIDLRRPKAYI